MKTISIIVIAAIGALTGVGAVALPAEGNALVREVSRHEGSVWRPLPQEGRARQTDGQGPGI